MVGNYVWENSINLVFIMTLSACQVNHIRDVKGGTVAPSSSRLTGVEIK